MDKLRTSKVVLVMLALSLIITAILAILKLSAFFLSVILPPALTAAYYQKRHGVRFDKPQRKSISRWYVGTSMAIGVVPLAMLVAGTHEQLNEPFAQVVLVLLLGVIALMIMAYFVVYWLMGMEYVSKSNKGT